MDEESELPHREQKIKGCTFEREFQKQQSSRRAQPTNKERPPPFKGMTREKGERAPR